MATTTNYGWPTPDDTDFVKDGADAIRTLGSSIDSTTEDLNPATTEGDMQYASATAHVNERLAIGTAGQLLAVNSGADAPEWVTPAGSKVLQIQSGSLSTSFTTSSATYADAGLSVTITPNSASSKILLLGNFNYRKDVGNAGNRADLRILRDSTTVFEDLDLLWTNTAIYLNSNYSLAYLDSPNTTSAITYKLQAANANATANIIINYSAGTTFHIYALEIGA